MVVCPDCGKDVKEAKFCSNCGAVLPKADEVKVEEPVDEVVETVENDVVEEPVGEVVETVENDVVEEPVGEVVETVENDVVDEPVDEGETIEVKKASKKPEDEPVGASDVKKPKFCPNCGAEIAADIAFCPKCGFKFNREENQTKFCQSCGKKININAEICPYCGVRVAGIAPRDEKSVLIAAILSFLFPGLGHLYNGLTKKGLSFMIAYIVSAILILLIIGFVLVFIIWIWALIDAIKTTEAINNGEYVEDKLL